MYRCRIAALGKRASASPRLPKGLAALMVLGIAALAWGQAPTVVPPAPVRPAAKAPTASAPEALSLDRKLIAEAKEGSEIMANLAYLSDMIGPRLTGSAALKRANEWTAERMRSYGLTNVHLEAYTIPMGWERGSATGRIIEPDNGCRLSLAAQGWTPGTKGKIEGEVVIITARTSADLATLKGKLKDAIILRGPPANIRPITDMGFAFGRDRSPSGPGATPGQRRQRGFGQSMGFRRELMEFLRTEGAAAILQDAGKPHGLLTAGGGWQGLDRPSAADPIPALFVAHEHYGLLYRLASRPAPARTRIELEVHNRFIPGPIAVYNTVGEIEGSEKPDEYVILGAHLDSWDLAQGTTDNGTGSMVVLETARILARCGTHPKHGSKAYVKEHKRELPRISMCLAHDTGTGRVVGIGLQGRAVLKPLLETELVSLKELGVTEINLRSMGGTDHVSFEQAGVPGFAVRQDMAEYRLTHHSQSDTLDKAREADLIQGAQVMAVAAMRVANLPTLLPREKNSETASE